MKYIFKFKNYGQFFSVPSIIANKYLKSANGDFIKVLLYIFSMNSEEVTTKIIADSLNLKEDLVDDAIVFWNSKKIFGVCIDNEKNEEELKEIENSQKSIVEAVNPTKNSLTTKNHVKYSSKDIAVIINQQKEIKELYLNLEQILKRPLRFVEQCGYLNLVENYGLPIAGILLLAQYCYDIDKTSMRYIETIADSWFNNNITTYPQIECEINTMIKNKSFERKVLRGFGMKTRPTKKQEDFIEGWKTAGFSVDMVMCAYERCIDSINELSFSYINGIIKKWYKNKIFTTEDLENSEEKFTQTKKVKRRKGDDGKRSYDLDEFDDFSMNYIPKLKEDK